MRSAELFAQKNVYFYKAWFTQDIMLAYDFPRRAV